MERGENAENCICWESFNSTIDALKMAARKKDVIIENQDIMKAIGISEVDFYSYVTSDVAPEEVFRSIRSTYRDYITHIHQVIRFIIELPPPPEDDEEEFE